MSTENVKKNTKTGLEKLKKEELINIILRKDDIEAKNKSFIDELNKRIETNHENIERLNKELNSAKECVFAKNSEIEKLNKENSNLKISKDRLSQEKAAIVYTNNELNKKLTNTNNSLKFYVILSIALGIIALTSIVFLIV